MKIEFNENGKWRHSFTIKMLLLAFMGLFLLIPLELIKEMIGERQANSELVKKEISSQWSGAQTVSGPVLNVPLIIYPTGKDVDPYRSVFHIMPENLNIQGDVQTEKRHRSIYEAVVYTSSIDISGDFVIPEISTGEKTDILWDEAYYSFGISDNRGIKGGITLKSDSVAIEAIPGLRDTDIFASGITFPKVVDPQTKRLQFSLAFNLSGSESIFFTPMGKSTEVNLKSPWSAPGFLGSFLPAERIIDENGFEAKWLVTNLNRNFPQAWRGNAYKPESDSFGTNFVLLVDHYQKSIRSAKYGILFIALTFLALLFVEISTDLKIHVFHYLLLALGLILFFSLLNALSEQIGFNLAYLAASVATIALFYSFLRELVPQG
jgi:inner membrane protein